MTEEDVKIRVVIPWLAQHGFDRESLHAEQTFKLQFGQNVIRSDSDSWRSGTPTARLDLLVTRDGKNLCVVEVKRDGHPIGGNDVLQATSYARLVHPVAPVAVVHSGREWRVFDTLTREEIPISRLVEVATTTPAIDVDRRREAMEVFFAYLPETLLKISRSQVERSIARVLGASDDRDKKFIPELYEADPSLDATVTRFLASDRVTMLVTGDSGCGKTSWIGSEALRQLSAAAMVFFFLGGDLRQGILEGIADELNWAFPAHHATEEAVNRLLRVFNRPIVLFVDGLEGLGPAAAELLDQLLARVPKGRLKLLTTAKARALPSLLYHNDIRTRFSTSLGATKPWPITGFDEPRFASALERYRKFYGFDNRGRIELALLDDCQRSPFLLRLVFEAAADVHPAFVSYDVAWLFEQYLSRLSRRFGNAYSSAMDTMSALARLVFEQHGERIMRRDLWREVGLALTDDGPGWLYDDTVFDWVEGVEGASVSFYFDRIRDYVIARYAFGWHQLGRSDFEALLRSRDWTGIGLDVLETYYATASDEHRRVIDEPLHSAARTFTKRYDDTIQLHFRAFKVAFPPGTAGPVGFVGYFSLSDPTRTLAAFAFFPARTTNHPVSLYSTERFRRASTPRSAMVQHAIVLDAPLLVGGPIHPNVLAKSDIVRTCHIREHVEAAVREGKLDETSSAVLLGERVLAVLSNWQGEAARGGASAYPAGPGATITEIFEVALFRLCEAQWASGDVPAHDVTVTSDGRFRTAVATKSARRTADLIARARVLAASGKLEIPPELVDCARGYPELRALVDDLASLARLGISALEPTVELARPVGGRDYWQSWSTDRAGEELVRLFVMFHAEYRALVERNFPTNPAAFEFYRQLPLDILVIIDDWPGELTYSVARRPLAEGERENGRVRWCRRSAISSEGEDSGNHLFEGETYRFWHGGAALAHILRPSQTYVGRDYGREFAVVRSLVYGAIQRDLTPALDTILQKELIDGFTRSIDHAVLGESLRLTREERLMKLASQPAHGFLGAPPLLLSELLNRLSMCCVDYVVVGDVAATVHGSVRITRVLEIVYSREPANLQRLVAAITPLEPARRDMPSGRPFVLADTLAGTPTVALTTTRGHLNLLADLNGVGGYRELLPLCILISAFGVQAHCLDVAPLMEAKRMLGRLVDHQAAAELGVILEIRHDVLS